jgi:hypothetical protein
VPHLLCFEQPRPPTRGRRARVATGRLPQLDAAPNPTSPCHITCVTPLPLPPHAMWRRAAQAPPPSSTIQAVSVSSQSSMPLRHFLTDAWAQVFLSRAEPLPGSPSSAIQDTVASRRSSGTAEPPSVLLYPCVMHHTTMPASVPVSELQPRLTVVHQRRPDTESIEHRYYILHCTGRRRPQSGVAAKPSLQSSSPHRRSLPLLQHRARAPPSSIVGAALSCHFSPVMTPSFSCSFTDPASAQRHVISCEVPAKKMNCYFHGNVLSSLQF